MLVVKLSIVANTRFPLLSLNCIPLCKFHHLLCKLRVSNAWSRVKAAIGWIFFVCVLLSLVSLFVVVVTRPALFTTTLLCQHVQVTCCCHYYVTYNVDKLTYIFVRQDSLNRCGCFRLLGSAYTDCINQQAELHTTHTHTGVSNPPQPRAPPVLRPSIYLSVRLAPHPPNHPIHPCISCV